MRKCCLIAVILGLVFGSWSLGQDKVNEQVRKLVIQLKSTDKEIVSDAHKKLVELGVPALNALEESAAKASESLKKKLVSVRDQIEQVRGQKMAKSTKVTLEGEMTLAEALKKLEKQSKTTFAVQGQFATGRLELSMKDAPFWNVMDELMDQAKLQLSAYGGETGQLSLVRRAEDFEDYIGRTAYSNGFRVVIKRIETSVDYEEPMNDGTNIRLQINWESQIKPIAIEHALKDIKAIDEYKDDIAVRFPVGPRGPNEDAVISETVQPDIPVTEMFLPLELIDRKIKQIDKLTGTINVLMPGHVETFDFGQVGKIKGEKKVQRARATVTFLGTEKNDELQSLGLTIEFDKNHNPLEIHQGWILDNEIYLEDAAGKKHKPIGSEQALLAENKMSINYFFEVDPAKHKLVYRSPVKLVKIPVKYTLKKIILP